MTVDISFIRQIIPDRIEPYSFSDVELSRWVDKYVELGKKEQVIPYYVAIEAFMTLVEEAKLNDADIKQNSISISMTGAGKEKLIDLYNGKIAHMKDEIDMFEGNIGYFNVVEQRDEYIEGLDVGF
jgi:hypothetical protein